MATECGRETGARKFVSSQMNVRQCTGSDVIGQLSPAESLNPAVHPALLEGFPELRDNAAQLRAVAYYDGPLLIIAGPGSGKTQVLVWRTLNLLLTGKAEPGEILVCTFTEKAA